LTGIGIHGRRRHIQRLCVCSLAGGWGKRREPPPLAAAARTRAWGWRPIPGLAVGVDAALGTPGGPARAWAGGRGSGLRFGLVAAAAAGPAFSAILVASICFFVFCVQFASGDQPRSKRECAVRRNQARAGRVRDCYWRGWPRCSLFFMACCGFGFLVGRRLRDQFEELIGAGAFPFIACGPVIHQRVAGTGQPAFVAGQAQNAVAGEILWGVRGGDFPAA
jgi:hypothetical protein